MKEHITVHTRKNSLKHKQSYFPTVMTRRQSKKSSVRKRSLQKDVIKCRFCPCSTQESKSITPKKESKSITPKKESKSITPKKESKSIIPKKESKSIIPKKESKSITPKKESKSINKQTKSQKGRKPPNNLKISTNHRHIQCRQNKSNNFSYICQNCSYMTTSVLDLRKHKETHMKAKHSVNCSLCSYKAVHVIYLQMHMMGEHTQQDSCKCNHCGYKSEFVNRVKSHMMSHTGFKPFTCSMCSYRSRRSGNLKSHMKIHAKKLPKNNFKRKKNSRPSKQTRSLTRCQRKSRTAAKAYTQEVIQPQHPNGKQKNVEEELLFQKIQSSKYPRVFLERLTFAVDGVTVVAKQLNAVTIQPDIKKVKKKTTVARTYLHNGRERCCSECSYSTIHSTTLRRHFMARHSGEKPYQCSTCQYRTISKFNLRKHEVVHAEHHSFICLHCSYKTTRAYYYTRHMKRHARQKQKLPSTKVVQKDPPVLPCRVKPRKKDSSATKKKKSSGRVASSSQFLDILSLKESLASAGLIVTNGLHKKGKRSSSTLHSGDAPENSKNGPKFHENRKGQPFPKERFHECSLCPFRTTFLFDINQHMMSHTGERPFSCPFCSYKARRSVNMESHMLVHEPSQDKSQVTETKESCSSRGPDRALFQHPSALQITKVYSVVQSPEVKTQTKPRAEAPTLKVALPLKRKGEEKKRPQNSVKENENCKMSTIPGKRSKSYGASKRCPTCLYSSAHWSTLKRHIMSRHTGEKPWKCELCPYSTVSSFNLKQHVFVHSGLERYRCDLCPYKARQINTLRNHMLKIHNVEKNKQPRNQTPALLPKKECTKPLRQGHFEDCESRINSNFCHGSINVEVLSEEMGISSPFYNALNEAEMNSFENLSIKQEKVIKMEIEEEFLEDPNDYLLLEGPTIELGELAYTPSSTSDDVFFQESQNR